MKRERIEKVTDEAMPNQEIMMKIMITMLCQVI